MDAGNAPMDREHARLCATKVWHIYTCATCATNVAQVWHTKGASHRVSVCPCVCVSACAPRAPHSSVLKFHPSPSLTTHLRPGYCTICAGPQCATKCGTFDMCATSAINVAQNVAQLRPASNDLE